MTIRCGFLLTFLAKLCEVPLRIVTVFVFIMRHRRLSPLTFAVNVASQVVRSSLQVRGELQLGLACHGMGMLVDCTTLRGFMACIIMRSPSPKCYGFCFHYATSQTFSIDLRGERCVSSCKVFSAGQRRTSTWPGLPRHGDVGRLYYPTWIHGLHLTSV